ncbi:MAG: hypothetical protein LBS50_05380 [Prevotellaceae bacterium]|jgi:hypothetical protein|nr:hypothetical protein [Prevotellaceae bacterium]
MKTYSIKYRKTVAVLLFVMLCIPIFIQKTQAQTPVPISQSYYACPGVSITAGFIHNANITYTWWYDSICSNIVIPGTRDAIIRPKDGNAEQTLWARPTINGVLQNYSIKVTLYLSDNCGSTAPSGCYATGNVIFNEDYGGNNPSDPDIKPFNAVDDGRTNYTRATNPQGMGRGQYVIAKSSFQVSQTHTATWWHNIDDHTYPNDQSRGYFFMCDAADDAGQFYQMQIDNLCTGTQLMFSAWIVSLTKSNHTDKANLIFIVEDIYGNVLMKYFTGNIPEDIQNSGQVATWRNYGFAFSTPTSSIKLRILNNGTGSGGNDFCIDDIQVRLCAPQVTLTASDLTVCEGAAVNVGSTYVNNGFFAEPLEYQWYFSTTGDIANLSAWTALPAEIGATFNKTIFAADIGYYRLAISGAGNRGNFFCSSLSNAVHIGLVGNNITKISETICEGSYYDFGGTHYTTSGVYTHEFPILGGTCDSVVELTLKVEQIFYFDTLTLCSSALPYNYHGKIFPIGTVSKDTVFNKTTVFGCDSVTTLHLVITESITNNPSLIICSNELPYAWRDTTFQIGTISKQIIFRRTTAAGCDSIVTLTLIVNQAKTETVPLTICSKELLPSGYVWRDTTFQAGTTSKQIIFRRKTSQNCDSTVTLNLIVNQETDTTIHADICQGETYTLNGQNYTTANTYTQTRLNVAHCDSTITLILTVNLPTYSTITDSLCIGETYKKNGFNVSTDGTHTRNEVNAAGCDSLITLILTYASSHTFLDTVEKCANDFPFRYQQDFVDTVFNAGTASGKYIFGTTCDGIVLTLTVLPIATTKEYEIQNPICADDNSFWVKFPIVTSTTETPPTNYEIVFDQNAKNAGFIDKTGIFNGLEEFVIDLPQPIYPDKYYCTITLFDSIYNCNSLIINKVELPVLYPDSIMQQKWGDVIALLNKYYNGGFEFTAYQWYKNNEKLVNQTGSYIYTNGTTLNIGDKYSVEVTRLDGTTMHSCPIEVQKPKDTVSVYPTVVQNDNSIKIYLTEDNALARLWSVTGILMQTAKKRASAPREIDFPASKGAYIIEIQYEESQQRIVVPVVVR